jgi:hypothetical protein
MKKLKRSFIFLLLGPVLLSGIWFYFQWSGAEKEEDLYVFSTQVKTLPKTIEDSVAENANDTMVESNLSSLDHISSSDNTLFLKKEASTQMGFSEIELLDSLTLQDSLGSEPMEAVKSKSTANSEQQLETTRNPIKTELDSISKQEKNNPTDSILLAAGLLKKGKKTDFLPKKTGEYWYKFPEWEVTWKDAPGLIGLLQLEISVNQTNYLEILPKWEKELKTATLNIFYFTPKHQMALPKVLAELEKTYTFILPQGTLKSLRVKNLTLRVEEHDKKVLP